MTVGGWVIKPRQDVIFDHMTAARTVDDCRPRGQPRQQLAVDDALRVGRQWQEAHLPTTAAVELGSQSQ